MGTSYIPTYRVEYRDSTMHRHAASKWLTYDYKRHGKPTDAKAEDMRKMLNTSFAPGGVNFHASKATGVLIHVNRLKIVRQADNAVMGEAVAPMFEAV